MNLINIPFWRLGLIAITIALAFFSMRDAAVFVFATRSPELARWLNASDPTSIVTQHDRALLGEGASGYDAKKWNAAALSGLAESPLSAGLLRISALSGEAMGKDVTLTRRTMKLSENVSRRDLAVQIWLIQDSVADSNVSAALKHYDRALSVRPAAAGQLFPILAAALDAPEIRAELAKYIRWNRPWVEGFLEHAIFKAASPLGVQDLFRRSGGSKAVPQHRRLETLLLRRLTDEGEIGVAWALARQLAGPREAALSRFQFSTETLEADLLPFTWALGSSAMLQTTYTKENGIEILASPGSRGIALSRVVRIAPGRWFMDQRVELPGLGPMANSTWTAHCLSKIGSKEIWIQDVPLRPGAQRYRSSLNVPTDCLAVRLELLVRGSDHQEDARIVVSSVRLARA